MKSETGYTRLRSSISVCENYGTKCNDFFLLVIDRRNRSFTAAVQTGKEPLINTLASVFLDNELVWRAFRVANRRALAVKFKKEVKDERN